MKISLRGWYRRARNHHVIDKSLLEFGTIAPSVNPGYYHKGYNYGISYNQISDEKFELIFKSPVGPSYFTDYRYSVEFDINELLPFIRPLLAKKTLSELGLSDSDLLESFHSLKKGKLYSQSEIWFAFNRDYHHPDRSKWFPKYSKSKDGEHLLVFLNLTSSPSYKNWLNSFAYEDENDSYDKRTRLIHWWGNKSTNSNQPLFQDVINNNLSVHFFTNWNKDEETEYLGEGKFLSFNNNIARYDHGRFILLVHQII